MAGTATMSQRRVASQCRTAQPPGTAQLFARLVSQTVGTWLACPRRVTRMETLQSRSLKLRMQDTTQSPDLSKRMQWQAVGFGSLQKRQAALQHYLLISALKRQQLDVELREVLALRPASASLSTQLAAEWCSLQTQVGPDPASRTLHGIKCRADR